jgi:GNAT superfamily N-acetyltransferase
MLMTSSHYVVRQADTTDAGALTHILATGFREDPPLIWLLPDDIDRQRLSPAFFRPFVDLVLTQGHASITEDGAGCALWLDVDVTAEPDEDGASFRQLFIDGLGTEYAKRFFVLDDLFSANHPTHESHRYLLFIGVVPHLHSHGIGTALLTDEISKLDTLGRPAYLEASCLRNAALYARLGFTPFGEPLSLPEGGPSLHPMWRSPSASHPITI